MTKALLSTVAHRGSAMRACSTPRLPARSISIHTVLQTSPILPLHMQWVLQKITILSIAKETTNKSSFVIPVQTGIHVFQGKLVPRLREEVT